MKDSYGSEGEFLSKGRTMGAETSQDIRELRADVMKIATEGCAHKITHDNSIKALWQAHENDQRERTTMFTKFVILTLSIVLAGLCASYYATSSAVEAAVTKAMHAQLAPVTKR